ncbi:hypothetical protein JG688_00012353 [Phytophthora aleatoria]|uniref:Uncharacterized protein n=1 Tax=Phytophthora aleatoria TaxID=2496075 RepID=A0A8J5MES1_9STRA|nr:hypothetical protein JG688_00012353 [Phytophthora aleatoria]
MLSCKTFLKLFAVAVALSDFTAHAGSAHAADCEMIYDVVTPAPTVPVTPCPSKTTQGPEVQDFTPTDVEGQSTTHYGTPSIGYNTSADNGLVGDGDVLATSKSAAEHPSTANGDTSAPSNEVDVVTENTDTPTISNSADNVPGVVNTAENEQTGSLGEQVGTDADVSAGVGVDADLNANVGAGAGVSVGAGVGASLDADADADVSAGESRLELALVLASMLTLTLTSRLAWALMPT